MSRGRAYFSLALGVFGIGWSAILVRWAGTPGLVSAFYRLAIATLVFVPWRIAARSRGNPATPVARESRRNAIIAGAFFAADLGFFNSAVMETSATNATLLGVNAPIFVALGAWVRSWSSLIALALSAQVVGHLLIAHAMGALPATLSSIVLLAQAPLTALLAWPLLGEPIRIGQIVGGALVLAGIMIVNVTRASRAA
jgi:drug/metabolite transporter (DMT)-like permease